MRDGKTENGALTFFLKDSCVSDKQALPISWISPSVTAVFVPLKYA